MQLVEVGAGRLHELDRAVDLVRETLVLLVGGVLREALVPGVHLAEVGEAALRERADEIDGGCRGVVALQQPLRVGPARTLGEVEAVDDVAAVGRKRDVAARLGVARAGLGELARHPPHLHDGHRRAVREHDGHLQHRLDAVADLLGRRAREGLGAVAALQQERAAGGGAGEPVAEVVDLAGEDERRQRRDLGGDRGDRVGVGPLRLLLDRQGPPVVEGVELLKHPSSLAVARSAPAPRDARPPSRQRRFFWRRSLTVDA